MSIKTLSDLVGLLNATSAKDFGGGGIDSALDKVALDCDELAPFIFFREETYGRNLIARTKEFELLVLTWLPGQRTPIHNHDGQRCWMWMNSGTLTFKNYKPISLQGELVPTGSVETHSVGDLVYIDDGKGIHSIANASKKPAVSLHLYAGPVSRCRIYNEKIGHFEWVELSYFTDPLSLAP